MTTLNLSNVFTPATQPQWLASLLANMQTLGLSTTSWQSGGMARTILVGLSNVLAASDQIVSTMAQGGFLDFAASVTPDPSVTPAAVAGWLDILADSVYNVQRIGATFATGSLNVVNSSASVYGPFAPGTYHVSNPSTNATYSNVSSLTIAASVTTPAAFIADVAGSGATSAPGTITTPITALIGVTVTNLAALIGATAESNTALVARCRAKLASVSPNGPKGAYLYFATTASQLLALQPVPVSLIGGPITRALVVPNTANGIVQLYVANAGGTVHGVSQLGITNATNANPIVITSAAAHGLNNGDQVTITGVTGNTGANGTFTIGAAAGSSLTLTGSVGNGAYVSGGILEGSDLGEVDVIVQANAVPVSVTATTASAGATNVAVVCNVWVPAAQASSVAALVQTALTNYFAALPIGGLTDDAANEVPFDAVLAAIFVAGSQPPGTTTYIQQVTLTLNGGTVNITVPATNVAVLSPTPTVNVFSV